MGLLNKGDYIIGGLGLSGIIGGVVAVTLGDTGVGVFLTTLGGFMLGAVCGVNLAAKTYHRLVEKGEL